MRYFGGKHRLGRAIAAIINDQMTKQQLNTYVEPFVGACSVLQHVTAETRIASDINPHMITLWKAVANGWEPPHSTDEETYTRYKASQPLGDPLTGFLGVGCSFAGKWYGSFARSVRGDDFARAAARSCQRKRNGLRNVRWLSCSYEALKYTHSFVYCDPPYNGTAKEYITNKFDTSGFWAFYASLADQGCTILISEYSAPNGVKCVRDFSVTPCIRSKTSTPRKEKLFVLGKWIE